MNNKCRRHELKMLKYKRRLKIYRIKSDKIGNYYAFRSHSCPCSCIFCQQPGLNYNRAKVKATLRNIGFKFDN